MGRKAGVTVAPLSQSLASKSLSPVSDYMAARWNVDRLEKLGLADKATLADVHPQGEGALRAASTANKSVRKETDAFLGNRANELANRADDAYSTATGSGREGADKSIADFVAERKQKASPVYEQAAEEGAAFDNLVNTMKQTPSKAWSQKVTTAYNDPVVERTLGVVKGMEDPATRRRLQHTYPVLAAIRQEISADIGAEMQAAPSAARRSTLRGLRLAREKVDNVLSEMAPSHAKAVEIFSDESELLDAFNTGKMAGKQDPSLIAADVAERAGTPSADALRKGHSAAFRDLTVPNVDLKEFARMHDLTSPIKTKDAANRFKSAFGDEAYNQYKDQLLGMAEMAKLRAGKGESSTIDKLIEQADTDPFALAQLVGMLSTGNIAGAAKSGALSGITNSIGNLTKRSAIAVKNAGELRAQPGAQGLRKLLDDLQQGQIQAQIPTAQRGVLNRSLATGSRLAGSAVGRP